MGPHRSSSLRIRGDSSFVFGSGQIGGASDNLTGVVLRNAPGEPHFPLDKGKGRIDEIKYPGGSEYLKSAVQNALAVGPSRVEHLYGETFARRYRPPFGVQVWSPDILTSYVVQVPKIALFLDLFSVKEATEGFLYLSKHARAPLIISDLPSSHRLWKERYFFVSGHSWEYDPLDKDDTLGVPAAWTTPENLREHRFGLVWSSFRK